MKMLFKKCSKLAEFPKKDRPKSLRYLLSNVDLTFLIVFKKYLDLLCIN